MSADSQLGYLFIISGPSAVGKTTIVKKCLEADVELSEVVTHTTRKARVNEVDGRDYHFVEQHAFDELAASDYFVDYRRIFGKSYGISKDEIEKPIHGGQNLITDLDVNGAIKLSNSYEFSKTIFLKPPNIAVIQERLIQRNASHADINLRIEDAKRALEYSQKFDIQIAMNDLETGFLDVITYIKKCMIINDGN